MSMDNGRNPAAKHLGSILENVITSQPATQLEINESSLAFAKGLVINHILEATTASNKLDKLRSAEVPESRVGYKEPTGNGSENVTLDDNGGYTGNGKDTYYHSDRGQNANPDNSDNLAGSKQNYVESSTGKEAAGESGEISESGMGAGDLPDYEAMTRTGGSTSTHDEPDAKIIKKMGGIGKPPSIDEYRNTKIATNRKDAAKAIANVFKKIN